jgi:hypothetical protein
MSQKLLAMKPLPPRVAKCTVQSADACAEACSNRSARGPAGRCSPTPGSRRPVPPCRTSHAVLESPSVHRIPEGRSSPKIKTETDSCKQQAAQEQIVREQETKAQAEGIREAEAKEEEMTKQREKQEKNAGHTLVPMGCKR